MTEIQYCKNCKHLDTDGMFGLICNVCGDNKNMMESLIKNFLTLTSLIIGIFLIFCYHNCIFGEFWQVSVLVVGIMCIVWSQLFKVIG